MGAKDRLRALIRRAEGPQVSIPQEDGTVVSFPERDLAQAYLIANAREGGLTRDDHPLCQAARNSSDPKWRESVWSGPSDEQIAEFEEIEDLSEG
jgi:hypothetical protein